jgi:hypothetical protein
MWSYDKNRDFRGFFLIPYFVSQYEMKKKARKIFRMRFLYFIWATYEATEFYVGLILSGFNRRVKSSKQKAGSS